MTHRELDPKDERMIGRLIGSSGRRPEPRAEARDRIYAAVHEEWKRNIVREEAPGRRRRASRDWLRMLFRPRFAVVAVTVAAVGLSFAVFLRTPVTDEPVALASVGKVVGGVQLIDARGEATSPGSVSGATVFSGQRLITSTDGGAAIDLASGESVRINSGTELRFASVGSLELVNGAVYLDSERAPDDAGVVVTTPLGDVRHVGTQYEVRLLPGDLRVRVREGAVAIAANRVELIGRAGEQIVVPRSGDVLRTEFAATDDAWAWTESLAALPEASEYQLAELLAWVARQTGRDLQFENETAENAVEGLVLHGVGGLTPAEAYEVIRSTTALDYGMNDDSLIVY